MSEKTKILCVIDSLGSGGAQRQIVNLALGLKNRGYTVEVFCYHRETKFFKNILSSADILVRITNKSNGFSLRVLCELTRLLIFEKYDVVISFLDRPNLYSELAKLLSLSKAVLIVSERSSYRSEKSGFFHKVKRLLHPIATYIVTNSQDHANGLASFPTLKDKVRVIYNGFEVTKLSSDWPSGITTGPLKLLSVGRLNPNKNLRGLILALIKYRSLYGECPHITWVGRQESDPESILEKKATDDLLRQNPEIARQIDFLGEQRNITHLLESCDALIHISFFEGLPNAICEAFIAGRPVIASNTCELPDLVKDGVRGLLCDPGCSDDICAAIYRFASMGEQGRKMLSVNARLFAEQDLTIERMVIQFEDLFKTKPQLI
jgi:glycosyltransferase involved in cell wall biosynthesis